MSSKEINCQFNEIAFNLNKNKYLVRWEKSSDNGFRYLLLNYFLNYIKGNWSAEEVQIKVSIINAE